MTHKLDPIDVAQAAVLRDRGALMVDVREHHEYARAYIPGSVNLALSQLESGTLALDADQPVVFLCASGMRTATHAARLAAKAGDATAYVMHGGIAAWRRAGFPVQEGSPDAQASGPSVLARLFGRR